MVRGTLPDHPCLRPVLLWQYLELCCCVPLRAVRFRRIGESNNCTVIVLEPMHPMHIQSTVYKYIYIFHGSGSHSYYL